MNTDTISRAQLLEEIKLRRNQGTIGKVEAARWEKIVAAFPAAAAPEAGPPEVQEAKSLRWLAAMFPYIPNPEDENDRLCNAIHVYAQRGADKIESVEKEKAELLQAWRETCEACGYNLNPCEYQDCAAHKFRAAWSKKETRK